VVEDEITVIQSVLTTDCICEVIDEYGEIHEAPACFGCLNDMKFELEALLLEWRWRNGYEAEFVALRGDANWDHEDLLYVVDISNVANVLAIRGDYKLVSTLDDNVMTITRYSHDEPVGATFKVLSLSEDE
jgi:hypothetical protein